MSARDPWLPVAAARHPDLDMRAELARWAALLELEDPQIKALAQADVEQLRRLRRRIVARMYGERRTRFRRLALATRALPKTMLARLAVSAFGAKLSGRLVGEMDPVRAFKIAKRLPAAFIADAAAEIDPDRVRPIVEQMPAALIRDVALILIERADFIVMGRFADALSTPAIRAVVAAVDDDATLLHIAFAMEDKRRLTTIVHMIDNARVARIMRTGTDRALWPEALGIVEHVDAATAGRLAGIMAEQDEAILDDLVQVADEQQLWAPVLRALDHMDARHYRKIVNLPSVRDDALIGRLVQAAHAHGLLDVALPLAAAMQVDGQRMVAHATLRQGDDIADAVLWAAHHGGHWRILLLLAAHLDESERDRLAGLPALTHRRVLATLLPAAATAAHVARVLDVAERMDAAHRQAVAQVTLDHDGAPLDGLLDHVAADADWDRLAGLTASLDDDALADAARVYARRPESDRERFVAAARRRGVWDRLARYFTAEPA